MREGEGRVTGERRQQIVQVVEQIPQLPTPSSLSRSHSHSMPDWCRLALNVRNWRQLSNFVCSERRASHLHKYIYLIFKLVSWHSSHAFVYFSSQVARIYPSIGTCGCVCVCLCLCSYSFSVVGRRSDTDNPHWRLSNCPWRGPRCMQSSWRGTLPMTILLDLAFRLSCLSSPNSNIKCE